MLRSNRLTEYLRWIRFVPRRSIPAEARITPKFDTILREIVLLRWQSRGTEDSDNRHENFQLEALACLVPWLALIYRAHAGFYENEMPPVYRYPTGCKQPRTTTTGICHCLDPARVNRDDTCPSEALFSYSIFLIPTGPRNGPLVCLKIHSTRLTVLHEIRSPNDPSTPRFSAVVESRKEFVFGLPRISKIIRTRGKISFQSF